MSYCPENSENFLNETHRKNSEYSSLRKLYLAIGLCTLFMAIELLGGFLANSLAIISDAVHLLSDIAGFFTSVLAILISRKMATKTFTFGFQRAQTLGALASIAFVWIITVYLVFEAIERIKNPVPINGKFMFFIALFGVAVNIILAYTLEHGGHSHHAHHHHEQEEAESQQNNNSIYINNHENNSVSSIRQVVEDINLRAAFIHVLGDLVQSLGVLIASAIIWYNDEWRIADPICTLLFSVIVFISTVFIIRDILQILMEGTPKHISISDITKDIENVQGVVKAHDLHVWTISTGNIALTVHVTVEATPDLEYHDKILSKIQELLCSDYNIHHSTIQIERGESLHCNPASCVKTV